MWTTKVEWYGGQHLVWLMHNGIVVVTMTLDDWAKLSATKYVAEELRQSA